MKIFLLWRAEPGESKAASEVANRLAQVFAPILTEGVVTTVRAAGPTRLAWLELQVKGFRAPFFEEDAGGWAFAPEYPLNARRLLRARAALPRDGGSVLRALAAELEARADACVRELIPPAALIWTRKGSDTVHVANDGLGQAPLYEYEAGGLWALTNRLSALRALGVVARPSAAEWAVRFTTHWFPQHTAGIAGARLLPGGTFLRIRPDGIERSRHDPLGDWVHPPSIGREDALELGRHALLNHLTDAMELWERPTVGLSGGWDSRAVTSCLRVLGADFDLRVRGQETHFDVLISAQLARIAGLPLRIKTEGGVPPATVEGLRQSMAKALLWQTGNFTTLKHKGFLAREGRELLDGGVVNVMGQHAGIGKADFARRIQAGSAPPEQYEERLLDELMGDAPPILRDEHLEAVRGTLRDSYRAALDHGLTGRGPLHFFFLHEYTRRWGAATVASQTGLVVTPFLTPDFIRAAYALPEEELETKPLHRHITGLHAPDWAAYPYTDQATEEDLLTGRIPPVELPREDAEEPELPRWRQTARFRRFHYKYYWKDVGKPLVKQALADGGFWTEVFDPERARATWSDTKSGPDIVLLAWLLPQVLAGELPAGP